MLVDLANLLNAFIEDALGATGSFGLTDLDSDGPDYAAPLARFRIALYETLRADGWIPPVNGQRDISQDDAMLEALDEAPSVASVAEDRAVVRAHKRQASESAHTAWAAARDARDASQRRAAGMSTESRPAQQSEPSHDGAAVLIEQMRRAMESRAVIEQAKGILMHTYQLTAEAAWNYLVRTSQLENVKLRTIAYELTESTAKRDGSPQRAEHLSPPGVDGHNASVRNRRPRQ